MLRRALATAAAVLPILAPSAAFAQADFSSDPYLSVADNPIATAFPATHWIENFEGAVSANFVASGGVVQAPGTLTDSVDGDDGAIDGSGTAGRSWYSNGLGSITFTFSAATLGALPTRVGIAFTDVGQVTGGGLGVDSPFVEVFGADNVSLGLFGILGFGDGSAAGGTAEDRFVVASYAGGIGSIRVGFSNSGDWEVDHLTAAVVPEPATWAMALGGLMLLGAMRRRVAARALIGR